MKIVIALLIGALLLSVIFVQPIIFGIAIVISFHVAIVIAVVRFIRRIKRRRKAKAAAAAKAASADLETEDVGPRPHRDEAPPAPKRVTPISSDMRVLASQLRIRVLIEYEDEAGSTTHREVTIYQIDGQVIGKRGRRPPIAYLYSFTGWCHMRQAVRHFLISRVQMMADEETGEVIDNPEEWLAERTGLPVNPTAKV
jgi:predicted DNA-binding transcriptional regulator YafY